MRQTTNCAATVAAAILPCSSFSLRFRKTDSACLNTSCPTQRLASLFAPIFNIFLASLDEKSSPKTASNITEVARSNLGGSRSLIVFVYLSESRHHIVQSHAVRQIR